MLWGWQSGDVDRGGSNEQEKDIPGGEVSREKVDDSFQKRLKTSSGHHNSDVWSGEISEC